MGDDLFDHLATLSRQQGMPPFGVAYHARLLADFGFTTRARSLAASAPDPSDRDLIFTMAEIGDPAEADALLRRSLAAHPASTLAVFVSAPEARAALAIRRHDPIAAVQAMQPAVGYQNVNFDVPYVLGTACLSAGDGTGAHRAFATILANEGRTASAPYFRLAQLGLARALVVEHNRRDAQAAYGHLLAMWKGADADVPVLQAARREAAALAVATRDASPR